MLRRLSASHRSWALAHPFRISRGVKTSAEVVEVSLQQDGMRGRGESVPYARYGESVASVIAQLESVRAPIEQGANRQQLASLLPAGAARNALDDALWDLQARLDGVAVSDALGHGPLPVMTSALTISLDAPAIMGKAAARVADAPLIKIKVDARQPAEQIRAVRAAAPGARLIVDPNESWDLELLRWIQPVLVETDVALVEQPLPSDDDAALLGFQPQRPICADESCHVAADLTRLVDRYQAVNIKLDKSGGLSEALLMLAAARERNLQVMVGCMICSSLGIAPALHIARHADFVDLDGPWWLSHDHADGSRFENGRLQPPADGFWGGR
ncbi:N-acetyl-D-Glu racemase DgcA [Pseudoxanthomonas dokdonensis]|uniref:Dipeptide epimerase n=1 Tax=Pseudoxanthomonas dokdonensis TaxID=344882 RepID=A0A0R0CJG3_9GAMM|nr:N-acetyl-D-Glu racemase DgcA [Pseudoxanthomonas dokdonensis]KRG70044.1 mandelate racemase [Pseudoxanthomonas dokdonensis]